MATKIRSLKKITPDPIVDSVVEIRFSSKHPEIVLAKLIKVYSEEFPLFTPTNIPVEIRNTDPGLKYSAEVVLKNDNYSVGIGENVIVFNCVNGYKGWDAFFPVIKENLRKAADLQIVDKIVRVGIRFVNFFDGINDINQNLNLIIDFPTKDEYVTEKVSFTTIISKGEFKHRIIATGSAIKDKVREGSLLDIDTYSTNIPYSIGSEDFFKFIDFGRKEEKDLFVNMLQTDFLNKFNPEYEQNS